MCAFYWTVTDPLFAIGPFKFRFIPVTVRLPVGAMLSPPVIVTPKRAVPPDAETETPAPILLFVPEMKILP